MSIGCPTCTNTRDRTNIRCAPGTPTQGNAPFGPTHGGVPKVAPPYPGLALFTEHMESCTHGEVPPLDISSCRGPYGQPGAMRSGASYGWTLPETY
jgi:hypothetical protein